MPIWISLYVQDRYSPVIEHLKFFHDHTIIIIVALRVLFFILILFSILNNLFNHNYLESQIIEFFWTFAPSIILIFLALPSIKILYLLEENNNPIINIKIIGYQWFWGYEYINDFLKKSYDSNLMKNNHKFKILETSNNIIIPYGIPIRLLVTSKDVIHSWAIPSLGAKIDAVPGRINQITILSNRPGYITGQCSEICGSGHRFIPIFLESINLKYLTSQ